MGVMSPSPAAPTTWCRTTTNNAQNVFVRDLQTGTTTLVSVSTDGVDPGNGDSFSPSISADGRYVLFYSKASNLASGSFSPVAQNLFLRDLQAGTTYALTSGNSGKVVTASMTPDGQNVAFIGVIPRVLPGIIRLEFPSGRAGLYQ